MARRYPIGIQTFSEIIREGYTYVDNKEEFGSSPGKLLSLILCLALLTIVGCSGGSGSNDYPATGFSALLEQAKGYTYPTDTMNPDTARMMALALLEHDSVRTDADKRMQVLRLLTDAARISQDYEEQLKWSTQLATLCREQGDETEALRTESEIGIVLTHLGQRTEGFAMLDKAIAQLEPQRRFAELDACIIAMKRKLTALSLLPSVTMPGDSVTPEQRYHNIISLAEKFVAKLDDYEQHPQDYADGSPRQPDSDEVAGYCDFYRSQGYVFLAQANASSGNREKARHYCSLFEQSGFGQTLNGRSAISETWRLLGDYDKMLATYDEIDRQADSDTLNTNYVRQLRGRAEAAAAHGDHKASQHYWQRHDLLSQAINDQLQASEAHDYAARYHAYEQQMEIQQREAEASRNALLAIAALVIALLAAGFAVYYFRQQRIIRHKNRVLVEQMTDAAEYKRRMEGEKNQEAVPLNPDETVDSDALSIDELSQHIRSVIIRERLYLSTQFDRQAAIDYFHLSKERIGAAFSQGSEFPTIADFINHCRLEYAKELLAVSLEMTIDDIASAAGFGTRRTFSRLFKERYSITPTEYRNQNV
ncbi:MAG: helix-turn-helix domain-containing protein [Prevotella sp.]|nr:helix-turn-helix domain-containing protein [Prevotella sp.]